MLVLVGFYLLLVVYFFVCLFLILVILAQEGKGGGLSGLGGASAIGETFGFGAASAALRKWTRNVAITFIVLTIVLTFWGEHIARSRAEKFLSGEGAASSTGPLQAPPVSPRAETGAASRAQQPSAGATRAVAPEKPAAPAVPATPSTK